MSRVVSLMFDSFKGSISAVELGELLCAELRAHLPDVELVNFPVSDGGDGFLESVAFHTGGEPVECRVTGPLQRPRTARYIWNGAERLAIIESAQANGLALLAERERDPLRTSTWGVGELLLDAARRGARRIIVGVGGSATVDGGIGMAQALGVRFLGSGGRELGPEIGKFENACDIDTETPAPRVLDGVEVFVACDVRTKLLDAMLIYGPQKGGTPETLERIRSHLVELDELVKRKLGREFAGLVMGGAAGGLAAGLAVFAGATLRGGMELFDELTGLREQVRRSALVVTGEGRLDEQSSLGKVVGYVSGEARTRPGIPVIAFCGSAAGHGLALDAVLCLTECGMAAEQCMVRPREAVAKLVPHLAALVNEHLSGHVAEGNQCH